VPFVFIHVNKTGGTSITKALGLSDKQHLPVVRVKRIVGNKAWCQALKFAFVRNPWDHVVSHFHFRVQTNQTGLGTAPIPFAERVRLAYGMRDSRCFDTPKMFMPQVNWLEDETGNSDVDSVGRFERIEADFREVCKRLRIRAQLPHMNPSTRDKYRAYYDDETVEIVRRCFAEDIAAFGYEF